MNIKVATLMMFTEAVFSFFFLLLFFFFSHTFHLVRMNIKVGMLMMFTEAALSLAFFLSFFFLVCFCFSFLRAYFSPGQDEHQGSDVDDVYRSNAAWSSPRSWENWVWTRGRQVETLTSLTSWTAQTDGGGFWPFFSPSPLCVYVCVCVCVLCTCMLPKCTLNT